MNDSPSSLSAANLQSLDMGIYRPFSKQGICRNISWFFNKKFGSCFTSKWINNSWLISPTEVKEPSHQEPVQGSPGPCGRRPCAHLSWVAHSDQGLKPNLCNGCVIKMGLVSGWLVLTQVWQRNFLEGSKDPSHFLWLRKCSLLLAQDIWLSSLTRESDTDTWHVLPIWFLLCEGDSLSATCL